MCLDTEGVIDAAVLGDGGWTVFDRKTGAMAEAAWRERIEAYGAQVGRYADMLRALSGTDFAVESSGLEGAQSWIEGPAPSHPERSEGAMRRGMAPSLRSG